MSVYRYARQSTTGESAGTAPDAEVDVTLTNPQLKPDLDRTMANLGYEFVGASEEREGAPLAFPETDTPPPVRARADHAAGAHAGALDDRPTPRAPIARHLRPVEGHAPRAARAAAGAVARIVASIGPFRTDGAEVRPLVVVGRREAVIGTASIVVLALAVHWVALAAPFHTDDYVVLYASVARGFVHFLTDFHFRAPPLARAHLFAVERVLGARTPAFFVLPLALHLLASALLLGACYRLTRRPLLAFALAAAWVTSPVQQSALASLSSFGTVVAGSCAVLVARRAAFAASVEALTSAASLAVVAALLLVGAAGAPGGAGVAAPVVASVLLPRGAARRRSLAVSIPVAVVGLAAYVAFRVLVSEPIGRFFSGIPLLVEILVYGAGAALLGPIVAVASDGARAGWVENAGSALGASVPVFLAAAALVVWALVRGDPHVRRRTAALLAVPLAVALVETFDAADLVHGRGGAAAIAVRSDFQYLATLGWILVLASASSAMKLPAKAKRWAGAAVCGAVFLLLVVPSALVAPEVDARARVALDKGRATVESALDDVISRAPANKVLYVHNTPVRSIVGGAANDEFPGLAAYFAITHRSNVVDGRRVLFVESDPALLATIRMTASSRVKDLFVGEKDARGASVVYTPLEPPKLAPPARAPRPGFRRAPRRRLSDPRHMTFQR